MLRNRAHAFCVFLRILLFNGQELKARAFSYLGAHLGQSLLELLHLLHSRYMSIVLTTSWIYSLNKDEFLYTQFLLFVSLLSPFCLYILSPFKFK